MPDRLTRPHRDGRLLITADAVGGVWPYSIDLAAGLAERGIDTVLAVMGPAVSPLQRAEAAAVPGLHLVETGLPLDWTARWPSELAEASERLAALAALTGVDGVHLHSPALVGAARWPVPVVAVCHSCVATWWKAVRGGPMPDDFAWRMAAVSAGVRAAGAVIAPTAAHASATQAVYGPVPIHVVPNGRRPLPRPDRPRQPAVLTAGRLWDEGKGAAMLDRAAAGLGVPVLAAGALAAPDGTAVSFQHMHALGTLGSAELAAAYGGATVFASMAGYEPFGLAVLEAAQAGLALVLLDTPGFRELWDGAALFVANEAALQPTLRRALANPAPWASRAQAQAGRYTVAAMADGTLGVHRALVMVA